MVRGSQPHTRRSGLLATGVAVFTLGAALAASSPVRAGGMFHSEIGTVPLGRAGAMTASSAHPVAVHYNPAGLARLSSGRTWRATSLRIAPTTFQRAGLPGARKVRDGAIPTVVGGGGAAWAGDGWAIAATASQPGGLRSRSFPRAGAQQFAVTNVDMTLGYGSIGAAFSPADWISIGATAQWVVMARFKYALTVDFTPESAPSAEHGDPYLAHVRFQGADWGQLTGVLGLHLRPAPFLEIGLATRPMPVRMRADGDFRLTFKQPTTRALGQSGLLDFVDGNGHHDRRARAEFALPAWVRAGIRFVRPRWDIELNVVWEGWSVHDKLRIAPSGSLKVPGRPDTIPLQPIDVRRDWRDTWAVRLGGDAEVIEDKLWLRGGLHWESAAAPLATTSIDFPAFERLGLAAGASFRIDEIQVHAAYQFIWQPPRTVPVGASDVALHRPASPTPGHGVGAGRYTSHFHTIALGATVELDADKLEID